MPFLPVMRFSVMVSLFVTGKRCRFIQHGSRCPGRHSLSQSVLILNEANPADDVVIVCLGQFLIEFVFSKMMFDLLSPSITHDRCMGMTPKRYLNH